MKVIRLVCMEIISGRKKSRFSRALLAVLLVLGSGVYSLAQQADAANAGTPASGLPLKPGRTIEFDTDEGTWLSLDVSPDGKTIIFEMLGDIYTLPIAGGRAKLLLGGMAFESQPHYSPDGSQIAFISDRGGAENLWIASADGTNLRELSHDEQNLFCSPAWMPDGRSIVVSRGAIHAAFELWMYSTAGGRGVKVPTGRQSPDLPARPHNALGAVFTRDGRFVYYAYKAGRLAGADVHFPLWQISRFDRQTGFDDLITEEQGSAFRPVLSPDGTKMVYGTRRDGETGLRIRDLHTDEERWLQYPVQHDDQENLLYSSHDLLPDYAFTPDGTAVIAAYQGKIHRIEIAGGKSQIIPFLAHVEQKIGPQLRFPARVPDGPVRAHVIQGPVQSPVSNDLAFEAFGHVYVMHLPDGTPRRIADSDGGEFQPAWSPDGKWIAFVTWTNNGGQIWKAKAAGSAKPQQITDLAAYYRDIAWSPDGARIVALKAPTRLQLEMPRDVAAFTSTPDQDVVWVSAEGGPVHTIVPARGLRHPQFTDEPDRIYFHSAHELISMRFDGSDRRTHINITGEGAGGRALGAVTDMRISPDGRWILAIFHGLFTEAYLVAVDPSAEGAHVNVSSRGAPAKKIAETGADYVAWADHGKTMTWSAGPAFYRQPLSSAGNGDANVEKIVAMVEEPRKMPHGTLVLRGAQIITMRGDEVLQDADVVVTGNRIAGVGPRGSVRIPAGAKILDVRGKTVIPGFIDMHDHWKTIRREVLDLNNWDFLATLAYGVTSGRDPNTETSDTFVYQDMVDSGQILGPRAFSTGPGIYWMSDIQDLNRALQIVRKYRDLYGTKMVKAYLVGNRRQRQLIAEACRELQMLPTGEGQSDMKLELSYIIDGFSGSEHVLPVAPLYKDVVELVARSGAFYTPTLVITSDGPTTENYFYTRTEIHDDPKARRFIPHNFLDAKTQRRPWARAQDYNFPKVAASAAKIVRAGGHVCTGGHGQFPGLAEHWEMWALASGGMTNMEVLRAATLCGAEAMGYDRDLGTVEAGKLADLVVLDRDPLKNIRNTTAIRYVIKNGELLDGHTLDEVWPEQKRLSPLWFWDDEPPNTDGARNLTNP